MPCRDFSLEEVLVLSREEFRPEYRGIAREQVASQQNVSGSTLTPREALAGAVGRPIIELSIDDPLGRVYFEMWSHRPEHAGSRRIRAQRRVEGEQPPPG